MIVVFIVVCASYSIAHVIKTVPKIKGAARTVVPVSEHRPREFSLVLP